MIAKSSLFPIALAVLLPVVASAQTGGPGQPEFMQFQQAGTSGLVDPSTGTFSYQIPLFSIGGYPMNLTYQSGVQMEDVASMVGLGWNLNPGAVVRTLRGLPDDFNGDKIVKEFSVKPNATFGVNLGISLGLEIVGFPVLPGVNFGYGLFYNTYRGFGIERSLGGSVGISIESKKNGGGSASLGMGLSQNSQSGVDRYASLTGGFHNNAKGGSVGAKLGKTWSVNSVEGLRESLNLNLSFNDAGSSVTLSTLNNAYQPDITNPFITLSGSYSTELGGDISYVEPGVRVSGYFSIQTLTTTRQEFSGLGLLYDNEPTDDLTLMDFNREKRLPYFFGESKILPIPYRTPDMFNVNAQGVSTTLSLVKNDVGIVGDARCITVTAGANVAGQVNVGDLIKIGGDYAVNASVQISERWVPDGVGLKFMASPLALGGTPATYQQEFFKSHGEINRFDNELFTALGSYEPTRFQVVSDRKVNMQLSTGGSMPEHATNRAPTARTTAISYLTASEAMKIGFDKSIRFSPMTEGSADSPDRVWEHRKGHHVSEISVTQPDGMKYVFGLPVYNVEQKEVTFNIAPSANRDPERNLVSYSPGSDNSVGNQNGTDWYFESMSTPAYPTQFLITAVLSPDYRDLSNDGISPDDLGNYVKFDYYKESELYKWRTPLEKNRATLNRGLRTDLDDDKGTYVYGTKELYYLKSMESRTEIAEFYYSERLDGLGVVGENGGVEPNQATAINRSQVLRKLDSIRVFSLPDRQRHAANAVPIKTIHFTYDYSLCEGTVNSDRSSPKSKGGKLTLKQVAFTYERSLKGMLTPYVFEYGKQASGSIVNPPYDSRDVNRWGHFQENPGGAFSDCEFETPLSNVDAPYASQNREEMNTNAYAWNLTDVTIPGGGKLHVAYEAHDYSYVQDSVAGRMFKIAGLSDVNTTISTGNELYTSLTDSRNRIYFSLDKRLTEADPRAELKRRYIRGLERGYLFYKIYVDLKEGNHEYVSGYARIKDYGVTDDGNTGYIDLEDMPLDDDYPLFFPRCNPMFKSALQFMRISRNEMVFGDMNPQPQEEVADLGPLFSGFKGAVDMLTTIQSQVTNQMQAMDRQLVASIISMNVYCKLAGYCRKIDLGKSFIRLYDPDGFKLAGGSRVDSISINDAWDAMAGNTHEGKAYTTAYDYTTVENGETISSGVAEYEPMIGGDEISLKQPIFYSDEKKLAPDNEYYVEEPVNESLFPAPRIVYGKVTQTTGGIAPGSQRPEARYAKTGRIVSEYFTAREYPVKVSRTGVAEERHRPPFDIGFLGIGFSHDFDIATVSQGFSIELNDMSGRPKSTWVYNESGDPVSGEEFEYFDGNESFTTVDQTGRITSPTPMGLSAQYTVDGRRNHDLSGNLGVQLNLSTSQVAGVPFPVPTILPSIMTEEKLFQSIAINKVIHRNAVLRRKTVHDQSSSVSTENLAFDAVTGQTLLTKTTNEFNDALYSFNYPAYWMYEGMGPAYRSTRVSGVLNDITADLQVGDELRNLSTGERVWLKNKASRTVIGVNPAEQPSISGEFMVYNPGAKNLLTASAGQVVTWNHNPAGTGTGTLISFDPTRVLNSAAVEFQDKGTGYCDSCAALLQRLGKTEYISGRSGNWNPVQNWFYMADRTGVTMPASATDDPTRTDIRTQGLFTHYNDFWKITQGGFQRTPANWEWKEKINLVDADGQTIETEDRIGRKVASLLGHRNTLVIAQAFNAGYAESLYDGFEDYVGTYCPPEQRGDGMLEFSAEVARRVRMIGGSATLTRVAAHTGKYSMRVTSSITLGVMPPRICDTLVAGKTVPTTPTTKPTDSVVDTTRKASPPTARPRPSIRGNVGANLRGRLPRPGGTVAPTPTATAIAKPAPCTDCVGGFYPAANKTYLFSCWVKVDKPEPILSCTEASVEVEGATLVTLRPEGPVIEGWQRVMGEFKTGHSVANLRITLKTVGTASWFDDLRVVPVDGNMVSYVYDDVNLRLTYTLDENNYFTKNEYNNQGELIRVKRETERGIVTIKEGNQSLVKEQ